MPRIILYTVVLGVFLMLGKAEAANAINWTFYGPGAGGKMQGGMSAASNNLEGTNVIRTLDDVRTGKSAYVTLASASVMKGRYYCIGTVTYTSPPNNGGDGKTHTLENVVGYVHDTGCAFNGTCSCAFLAQFCDGKARTDKMDIAVGNFTGYDGSFANSYITKNPNRAPKDWTQLAGLPSGQSQNPIQACGGQVRETGTPIPATALPARTDTPDNPLTKLLTQPPAQSYAPAPQPQAQSVPTSQPLYQNQPLPNTGPVPVNYQPDSSYPGSPVLTVTPQPNAGTVPKATNSILSSLFRETSATSGIRTLQVVAQSIFELFVVPTSSDTVQPPPLFARTELQPTGDVSNVSFMAISQYNDEMPQDDATSTPVFEEPVRAAVERPVSTFSSVSVDPRPDAGVVVNEQTLMIKVLTSFRSLLERIVHIFGR
jgi:hypothetical protein